MSLYLDRVTAFKKVGKGKFECIELGYFQGREFAYEAIANAIKNDKTIEGWKIKTVVVDDASYAPKIVIMEDK